ncbi:MAG: hypothetical protein E7379_02010 [Clostridiales bacterium]|nr:hypothetical protein [Clostridiales bacterium]
MNKKEYIEKIENLIVDRVTYHSPNLAGENVDYALLQAVKINIKYPIFLYHKPLNKLYFKAFKNAKKKCKFNLILTEKPEIKSSKLNKLADIFVLLKDDMGNSLKDNLNLLNINYESVVEFELTRKEEYVKINDQKLQLDFVPFYNAKKLMFNGIMLQVRQFFLNGNNYCFEFLNIRDNNNEIDLELNIPLARGYYSFKKAFNNIEIYNLTNKDRAYFNFFAKNVEVKFSCIDGLDNCNYACVNLKAKVQLKPKEKRTTFFNLGKDKFAALSVKDILKLFEESQRQAFNIFDTVVVSKDHHFDKEFNVELPKKIWQSWLSFSLDSYAEEKWLALKNKVISEGENGLRINEKEIPLKCIKLYRNNMWKNIFVMYGDSQFLFAGKVKYYNFSILPKEIFDKNNEIYLSFAW